MFSETVLCLLRFLPTPRLTVKVNKGELMVTCEREYAAGIKGNEADWSPRRRHEFNVLNGLYQNIHYT